MLWCFFYIALTFAALPSMATPQPYQHHFKILSITRSVDFQGPGECYEVDPDAERERLNNCVDPVAEPLNQKTESAEQHEAADSRVSDESGSYATTEEMPSWCYVEYDPNVIPVKDLPELEVGTPNILCHKQRAWFRVNRQKALDYGVPENKIITVKNAVELLDMRPYQEMSPEWENAGLSEEALEACGKDICWSGTTVLRNLSVAIGHAELEVDSRGFVFTSWLKSVIAAHPWHEDKLKKPDFMPMPVLPEPLTLETADDYIEQLNRYREYEAELTKYEAFVQWREASRPSRSRESLLSMFWPEWFEHTVTEENPQFVEKGRWSGDKTYHLTVNRDGVERIQIDAFISHSVIQQVLALTSFQNSPPEKKKAATKMEPALALPFHVLSGDVKTATNDFTYTPFARPRSEPKNRKLSLHTYNTHYRPELDQHDLSTKISSADIPVIPAVVYDFYSDEDDSDVKPEDRQPRLTYWVGTEGDYDGKLLGRRILYKTHRAKSIGCEAGPEICKFKYPIYQGLEYHLEVTLDENGQIKRETSRVRQPDDAREKQCVTKSGQMPPLPPQEENYLTQGLARWRAILTQAKNIAGVGGQAVFNEAEALTRSYLMSSFSNYVIEMASASMGVKCRSPIPTLPKIVMIRILHHLNLVH